MLTIDGSAGEGGGQVLRTSLALSAVTGTPFRIVDIRAGRSRPGLLRQHLTGLNAVAEVSGAKVSGNVLKSTEVTFEPGEIRPGKYHFAVGTAGSANLVLQTVLPPLMLAGGPSLLTLEGGTHNDKSPPYHFLANCFLPLLARMGPSVELQLDRWGFVPAGGGQMTAHIAPVERLAPLTLLERGGCTSIRAIAVVSALTPNIGHRELQSFSRAIGRVSRGEVIEVEDPRGPGNVVMAEVVCEHLTAWFIAFGAKRVSAERVGQRLAKEVATYLETGAPVDTHLADQLLLPLALAGGGRFRTGAPSRHTTTNIDIIERFLDVRFAVVPHAAGIWEISVD